MFTEQNLWSRYVLVTLTYYSELRVKLWFLFNSLLCLWNPPRKTMSGSLLNFVVDQVSRSPNHALGVRIQSFQDNHTANILSNLFLDSW